MPQDVGDRMGILRREMETRGRKRPAEKGMRKELCRKFSEEL